jgi:hypothetical protein
MMPIDMLKGFVTTVPNRAMYLDGSIGRLTAKRICPVVAHGDTICQDFLNSRFLGSVHLPGSLVDEQAKHFDLSCESNEWELNGLVVDEGTTEGFSRLGVFNAFLNTVVCCPET